MGPELAPGLATWHPSHPKTLQMGGGRMSGRRRRKKPVGHTETWERLLAPFEWAESTRGIVHPGEDELRAFRPLG